MLSFFNPVHYYSNFKDIPFGWLGGFAEQYWAKKGAIPYKIVKAHRKIDGQIERLEVQKDSSIPNHLSPGWSISKITLIVPLSLFAIKAAFRWKYSITEITNTTKKPIQLDEKLPLNEKIKQLHAHHFEPYLDDAAEAKVQDDLGILCELARPDVDYLFKKSLPCHTSTDKDNQQYLLLKDKSSEVRYRAFEAKLQDCLPSLLKLMDKKNKELLAIDEKGQWIAKSNPDPYKKLQKQLRYVFLYLLKQEKELSNRKKDYLKYIHHSLGNDEFGTPRYIGQPGYYFNSQYFYLGKISEDQIRTLSSYFQNFRRHLCLRISDAKVNSALQRQGNKAEIRELLKLTWLHGTRALTRTEGKFIPTGWLRQVGIVPFTGELLNGTQAINGVNQNSLSGTYLDNSSVAEDYSKKYAYSNEEQIKKLKFIDYLHLNDLNELSRAHANLPEINTAIQMQYSWDPMNFNVEYKPKLLKKLNELKNEVQALLSSSQKELVIEDIIADIMAGLALMEKLLNTPMTTELKREEKEEILNSFPSVIGSFTTPSRATYFNDRDGEHLADGALELGQDLQVIFIDKKDKPRVDKFLESKELQDKVKIYTFSQLAEARELNKIISPILADIFSQRKMALI